MLDAKNPQFLEDGRIRMDALFEDSPDGVYECHIACPNDSATRETHAKALAGEFGVVAPYVPPTAEELLQAAIHAVRLQRAFKLVATDWTQLPDVPASTKERWALYRQKLRDVSSQQGFPFNVVWPAEPT